MEGEGVGFLTYSFFFNMFTGRVFIHERMKLPDACQIIIFMVIVKKCSSSNNISRGGS